MKKLTLALSAAALSLLSITNSHAVAPTLVITEVDPTGSSTTTYKQDWFELTNYSTSAIDLTGYTMDDSSDSVSTSVALNLPSGVTSIAAGQSIVFLETTGDTASTDVTKFEQAWFGSNVPTGFTIGTYAGSNVGLSSSGDAVNIFNGSGTQVTGVDFGSATSNVSFDNTVAKVTNDGTISTLSVVGTNGAFKNAGNEIGSPGSIGAVATPEPSSFGLGAIAVAVLGFFAYRRRAVRA